MTTITLDAAEAAAALKKVLPFVPKRGPRPAIVDHVLLRIRRDGAADLTGTDLDIAARVPLDNAAVDGAGTRVLLPARELAKALKDAAGTVTLTVEAEPDKPTKVTARIGGAERRWSMRSADSFPEPFADDDADDKTQTQDSDTTEAEPDAEAETQNPAPKEKAKKPEPKPPVTIRIACGDFARAVGAAAPFAAKGEYRYALNGVYIGAGNDPAGQGCGSGSLALLDVAASDTHRLSRIRLVCEAEADAGAILNQPGAEALAVVLPDTPETLVLTLTEQHATLASPDGAHYRIRLIEGHFPRYNEVVPKVNERGPKFTADRAALFKALRPMPKGDKVRLLPGEGGNALRIEVYGEDDDTGKTPARAILAVPGFTAKMAAGLVFNARYLAEAIATPAEPTVTIHTADDLSEPATIRPAENHVHVLMPQSRGKRQAGEKVPAADRGAANLKEALALPDREVTVAAPTRGSGRKPKIPTEPTTSGIDADAVLAWLATATPEEKRRIAEAVGGAERKPARKATPAPAQPKRPSGLDAAAAVLADAPEPLTVAAIFESIQTRGLWNSGGKTPTATLRSAMAREIQAKGEDSRFVLTGPGLFAARSA